ncbi:MFS transporter [Streptomyces sp. MMS24-I31]|uniref:MFS transporter n=1 Tax=Streptomyces sp. MMS24-I31 TaxID=3351563 RepID=UPI003896B5C8
MPSRPPVVLSPGRRRAVLTVIALALMMVVSAVSGLNVALPALARDTGASQTELQWIVDAYTVVFAGLLLPAGAVGDRYGRRGVLLAGLAVFGAAAAVALLSSDPVVLIAMRAVMGLGAALVMPVTLSVITTSFPPQERASAVALWVGVAGGGAVIGLLASGALLEFFDWSSFFSLNVTLALLAAVGVLLFIPASRDDQPQRCDVPGAILSLLTIGGLVFGIIEGPDRGWSDPFTDMGFTVGGASLVGFVLWELRTPQPMLDPRLFRLRGFGTGSLSVTIQFFASFGFFFIGLQYLQFIVGYSPVQAALAMLPLPVVMLPTSRRVPALTSRFGANWVGAAGLLMIAAGLFTLSGLGVDFHYWQFAAGLVVFAAGIALASTPATTAIVASLPPSRQGVASAVNDTSREFGSALGIAILGSILNDRYRSGIEHALAGLPAPAREHARSSVAFVQTGMADHYGVAGARLVSAAEHAFVDGASTALQVGAAVLAATALYVAARAPRRGDHTHTPGQEADAPPAIAHQLPAPGTAGPRLRRQLH